MTKDVTKLDSEIIYEYPLMKRFSDILSKKSKNNNNYILYIKTMVNKEIVHQSSLKKIDNIMFLNFYTNSHSIGKKFSDSKDDKQLFSTILKYFDFDLINDIK